MHLKNHNSSVATAFHICLNVSLYNLRQKLSLVYPDQLGQELVLTMCSCSSLDWRPTKWSRVSTHSKFSKCSIQWTAAARTQLSCEVHPDVTTRLPPAQRWKGFIQNQTKKDIIWTKRMDPGFLSRTYAFGAEFCYISYNTGASRGL